MPDDRAAERREFNRRKFNLLRHWRRRPELKDYDYRVLSAVAELMDSRAGEVRVSLEKIAEESGRGKRAVGDAVKRLAGYGALRVQPGVGRGNVSIYRLGDESTHDGASFHLGPDKHKARTPGAEKAHGDDTNDAPACAQDPCYPEDLPKRGGPYGPPPASEQVESQKIARAEDARSLRKVPKMYDENGEEIPF
jgi:hypothetical protein